MFGRNLSIFSGKAVASGPVLRTGTNIVGFESQPHSTPSSGSSYYPPSSTTLTFLTSTYGIKSARLVVSWEAIQPTLGAAIPSTTAGYNTYWSDFISTLNTLLAANVNVMVDLWQYQSGTGSTDICYNNGSFTTTNFGNFWSSFATAINAATSNNMNVSFGLINEPHSGATVGGSTVSGWYAYVQAAITAIRGSGNNNMIYAPGWSYSDIASFISNGSAAQHLLLTDSANNLGVAVHSYNGQLSATQEGFFTNPSNANNTTAFRDAAAAIMTWSRANGNIKIHVGELACDNGNPTGTLTIAQNQIADWQSYCVANKDIIVSWNWWACGNAATWGTADSTSFGNNWGLNSGTDSNPSSYMSLISSYLGQF